MPQPPQHDVGGRPHLGILGTGTMGEAVLVGVLRGGLAPADVAVTARRPERAAELTERHGVAVTDVAEAASADVVVIGVKPQQLDALLREAGASVRPGSIVISLVAGATTSRLESMLPPGTPVVRTMPNTPALIGAGTTVICAGASTGEAHLEAVEELLGGTGTIVRLPEPLMDAATGLSGSGPAYLFAITDALAEGGVHAGLPRALAQQLAVSTLLGAARLLAETGQHPALAREQVTSPAGTTAAGLRELDERGVRAALVAAVLAAARRAGELSASPPGR